MHERLRMRTTPIDQIREALSAQLSERRVGRKPSRTARPVGVSIDLIACVFVVCQVDCAMRHRGAVRLGICDERVARVVRDVQPLVAVRWQPEDVLQPCARDFFDDRRRGLTGIERGVLIPCRGQPIGREGCRNGAANHPTEEPTSCRSEDARRRRRARDRE